MDFTNIMIIIISLISLSSSINFKSIPESRSPPPQMVSPSAVLDKASSSIYIIGGNQMSNDKVISDVNSFNLKTMTWKKIRVDSDYIPSGITTFSTILRSDKKILTFGYFTEIFIFNLENNAWTKEELKGHQIGNVMSFGFTSFNYNSSEFVAIFGGMKGSNYINDLVL
jgi:N-acetylneuraminic acid mutarotase